MGDEFIAPQRKLQPLNMNTTTFIETSLSAAPAEALTQHVDTVDAKPYINPRPTGGGG